MPRYIDARLAEKAMKKLEQEDIAAYGDDCESVFDSTAAIYALQDVPSADVAPVRHSRWRLTEGNWFECAGTDGCGYYIDEEHCGNYCPECGAKMDEEENQCQSQ